MFPTQALFDAIIHEEGEVTRLILDGERASTLRLDFGQQKLELPVLCEAPQIAVSPSLLPKVAHT